MEGFSYLDSLETTCILVLRWIVFFLLLSYSVVSACLPSPSSRNLLTCPVATSSAEHAGKGMLWCIFIWPADSVDEFGMTLIYFHWSS